jgi:FRG domain
MKGQWIGRYSGTFDGQIVVNVDEYQEHYQGIAYLIDDNKAAPRVAVGFRTPNKGHEFILRTTEINVFDPVSQQTSTPDSVQQYFPGVPMADFVDVKISWTDDELRISSTTNIGRTTNCIIQRRSPHRPSELPADSYSWDKFKQYVAALAGRSFLFRGQNRPWRLRTSFHRTGRADVMRFQREDFLELYKQLSARTKHVFNLLLPDEYGAFLNLIQHHGYPTPILDWTYSPYVAAFFAYRGVSNEDAAKSDPAAKVRIHVLDQARWKSQQRMFSILGPSELHFSIFEFSAIENERMIPQQAASTVTNVDDIEEFIRSKEVDATPYLRTIDLPVGERKKVITELGYMGITAGSLFPGLDGACEELKERNFEI